ncbi:MAG: VOC family protein [Acidimicrobiia bacterium]|nr:VOC family protein [Acidimicrobiia bacterium]
MITRLHHVAAVVPTLEDGVSVWRDIFGLHVECEATVPEQGVRACLLPCGDGEIELLQPLDPDGAIAGFAARGGGVHHVCFESDDVAAELSRMAAAGVRLIDEVPRPGLAGRIGFVHPKATLGSLVEIATPGAGVAVEAYAVPEPAAPAPVPVRRYSHLTYCVENFDAAAELFDANFGLEAALNPHEVEYLGGEALRVPLANAAVELARPMDAGGWLDRRLSQRGEGAAVLHLELGAATVPEEAELRGLGFDVEDLGDGTTMLSGERTGGMCIALS